jgi:serine/threonine protein kinase
MAPELFMPASKPAHGVPSIHDLKSDLEDVSTLKVTRHSDIWSFAMLVLELLTGEKPFPDKTIEAAIICALITGKRPKHPRSPEVVGRGLSNELWLFLGLCWELLPDRRPSLQSFYNILDKLATKWCPLPSGQARTQSKVIVSHYQC